MKIVNQNTDTVVNLFTTPRVTYRFVDKVIYGKNNPVIHFEGFLTTGPFVKTPRSNDICVLTKTDEEDDTLYIFSMEEYHTKSWRKIVNLIKSQQLEEATQISAIGERGYIIFRRATINTSLPYLVECGNSYRDEH